MIITIIIVIINHNYIFIESTNRNCQIGIIDSNLSESYDNVVLNCEVTNLATNETHGDKMIKFAKKYAPNIKIYYYDALSKDGKIHSENIISALDWMKKNNIRYVNISLSSVKYDSKIDEWINNNKDVIVYSSYNNLEQSSDYPSMYNNVIASGVNNSIKKKSIDLIYKSNKIKFKRNILKTYHGNSYLSIYSIINATNE